MHPKFDWDFYSFILLEQDFVKNLGLNVRGCLDENKSFCH